jgi:hypothetical protein
MRAAGVLIALVAALAAGCGGGGDDEPERSALALKLAAVCDQAREDVEELGLPGEVGFAIVEPTVKIGKRFAATIKTLATATEQEKEQISSLASYYDRYYAELEAGYKLYELGSADGFAITVERATALLESAEALAARMGAPECSERPFADTPPPG